MSMLTFTRLLSWTGFAFVVIGLPLIGHCVRKDNRAHCALDGVLIEPIYHARVVDEEGQSHVFCCLTCAKRWLEARHGLPQVIFVTDESSGLEIKASEAYFAASSVVTVPTSRNSIHAFANRSDAERQIKQFGGTLLDEADHPFVRSTNR